MSEVRKPFVKNEALGKLLKEELYSAASKFGNRHRDAAWKYIATKCDPPLSPSTVGNIATGKTVSPRFSTIVNLFAYFGMELTAIKRKEGNVVNLDEMRGNGRG